MTRWHTLFRNYNQTTPSRFSHYHGKNTPLFIPLDAEAISAWLDNDNKEFALVEELLEHPQLTAELSVQEVKTCKRGEALGNETTLHKD